MENDHSLDGEGVRLGVDFGTGLTVIAAAGAGGDCRTLEFQGISRKFPPSVPGGMPVHVVPCLVGYEGGRAVRTGDEADRDGMADDPSTARWLHRALCDNSPVQVPAGNGRLVRYDSAAADFLVPILNNALDQYPGASLVFSLTPGAPAVFREFLQRAARSAGAPSCSLVSGHESVLAGYGCAPAAREPVLLVTFSDTDLSAVFLVRGGQPGAGSEELKVLAQASGTLSCRALDNWIVRDILGRYRLLESDPRVVRLLPRLRYEAARLRERLPLSGRGEVRLTDAVSEKTFAADYTVADLDRILADHGVLPALQECIGRAHSALQARGGDGSRVQHVLLLGPGCALPAVQDAVRAYFPGAAVHAGHPLDAAARGAARHTNPVPVQARISRSYALRYWDPAVQEHHYRFLARSGTRYPSAGQVARVVISASYDGQALLGLPLYEIGRTGGPSVLQIELVAEAGGGVRPVGPAQDALDAGQAVHANERSPTLLVAAPPARKGEPRFECTFIIDADRNLCLTARDLVTGMLVKVNAPVYRLS